MQAHVPRGMCSKENKSHSDILSFQTPFNSIPYPFMSFFSFFIKDKSMAERVVTKCAALQKKYEECMRQSLRKQNPDQNQQQQTS
jgi:hypothetical protein